MAPGWLCNIILTRTLTFRRKRPKSFSRSQVRTRPSWLTWSWQVMDSSMSGQCFQRKKSWEESCRVPGLVLRMHGLQFILYSFCFGTLDHELFMRFCVIYPLGNTPSRQKKVGMVGLVEHVRYRRPTADLSLGWSPKSQESWLCLQNGGWLTWYFWVNYNDLTATSLEIMVSKGNHPQMALIQVSEILIIYPDNMVWLTDIGNNVSSRTLLWSMLQRACFFS